MRFGLRDWAERQPDRVAVVTNGLATRYGQLEETANRAARLFRSRGLKPGDHIAAVVMNDPVIFALVWAAYRAGLYFTPISSAASLRDVAYIVENSTAALVIVDARLLELVKLPGVTATRPQWFSARGNLDGFLPFETALAAEPSSPLHDERPGNLMMYTSGTTGAPKGVWRPLPTEASGPPPFARDLLSIFDIEADSRYLSTAPLYHAAALRFCLAFTAAGAAVHVMTKFDPAAALDMLERERITHSQWVPTMFRRLLTLPAERRAAFAAPDHRIALHGAAPCPVPLKRTMIEWWGPIIQEYYSGSEGVGLSAISSREWLRKPGSVGRCLKGQVHVLDEDWNELPTGSPGQLFFSGVAPFQYFNEPVKTKERTSPQGYQTFGDIGFCDDDGYIFLTDRLDDMIISGGVNIYPQEIEAALLNSEAVEDCAVVGVPDEDLGERAVAFVVLRDRKGDAGSAARSLDEHCLRALGRIKRPREFHFVDDLTRSPTGKLPRRELKRSLASKSQ